MRAVERVPIAASASLSRQRVERHDARREIASRLHRRNNSELLLTYSERARQLRPRVYPLWDVQPAFMHYNEPPRSDNGLYSNSCGRKTFNSQRQCGLCGRWRRLASDVESRLFYRGVKIAQN